MDNYSNSKNNTYTNTVTTPDWLSDSDKKEVFAIANALVNDSSNLPSGIRNETDGEEERDPEADEVRRKQRKALLRYMDAVVEYMADSNRHELDQCQNAIRGAAVDYADVRNGTILSKPRMQSYEKSYRRLRRGEPKFLAH